MTDLRIAFAPLAKGRKEFESYYLDEEKQSEWACTTASRSAAGSSDE